MQGAVDLGRSALLRASWSEAREHFEAAVAERETPEALAGLGAAARAQFDAETALDAQDRKSVV